MGSRYKQNCINHFERMDKTKLPNTPSATNLEEEEMVDASGNDGNASMPEQVKRPNPWRKTMMMVVVVMKFTVLIICRY
jgi:hypothetical protein